MKHCDDGSSTDFSGIEDAFKGLVSAQVSLGKELLKVADGALGALSGLGKLKLPGRGSCCDIPDPCWMPVSDGTVTCLLRPGAKGQLWLTVTNEDFVGHTYAATTAGTNAAMVTLSPQSLKLGPKERGVISGTIAVPADGTAKRHYDVLIWVAGCQKHYVRWEIDTTGRNDSCCHEVAIDDKPNYIVHWYDHFYCPRPCFRSTTRLAGLGDQ